jgi:hypothetical protein
MDLTPKLNEQSIESVREQIRRKTSSNPYLSNGVVVSKSVTDMDHQPYTRWFRGVYYYPDPIVMEREAGWRPINNACYRLVTPNIPDPEPHHCFEAACSTIFPCYPEALNRFTDGEKLDLMVNKACIVKYR